MELAHAGARELARAVATRSVSSRELVSGYLDRIAASSLNAVVTLDSRALADAVALDDETARGVSRGPLHGVPVTVKDAIATAGLRTTGGSPELASHVPSDDAPAVAALRAAGAVVLGKTNLPTWCGDIQTYNEVFGTTRNPWDLDRTPGGSSGGSAAAVAAGLTGFDLATDIAGSIRIPAHFCGVYGLKPSVGVVAGEGYVDHVGAGAVPPDGNVFGPICRTADDVALVLDVLASVPSCSLGALREFRVATWLADPSCRVGKESSEVLGRAVSALADAGARVSSPVPPSGFDELFALHLDMVLAAVAYNVPEPPPATATHRGWLARAEDRARVRQAWARWFADYDVLLCPVTAMPAFPHDQAGDIGTRTLDIDGEQRPHMTTVGWCGLFSVLGLPTVVMPVGFTSGGLPVGVQVVAPHLRDHTAVTFARLAAEVLGGSVPPPGQHW